MRYRFANKDDANLILDFMSEASKNTRDFSHEMNCHLLCIFYQIYGISVKHII